MTENSNVANKHLAFSNFKSFELYFFYPGQVKEPLPPEGAVSFIILKATSAEFTYL